MSYDCVEANIQFKKKKTKFCGFFFQKETLIHKEKRRGIWTKLVQNNIVECMQYCTQFILNVVTRLKFEIVFIFPGKKQNKPKDKKTILYKNE